MLLVHESWFVHTAAKTSLGGSVTVSSLLSLATPKKIVIVAAAAIVLIALIVEEFRTKRERWSKVFAPYLSYAPSVVGIATGIGIILMIILYDAEFAPDLVVLNAQVVYMILSAGALLVLGIATRLAALALLAAFAFFFVKTPWAIWDLLTNIYWVGLLFFLLVVGRGKWSLGTFMTRFFTLGNEHLVGPAVLVFRALLGASIMILGFTKIAHPEWHELLLQAYPFNPLAIIQEFLPRLSHDGYIFAIGIGEALLGLLLVLGIVIRPVASALAVFFLGSAIFLGPKELVGHLPLIGSFLGFAIMGRDGVLPKD